MKITKDVTVNTNNLIDKHEIEIVYSGALENSKEIYINYGYKPNSFEYKQEKLDNNNSIKIQLDQPGYFYFYFIDNVGRRDNNYYKDYQLYIKKSNLILTENSSMKELPYRYFSHSNTMYKTFYTPQTIKNTSKPQEIIIPRPFNINSPTLETKNIVGYTLEPVKEPTVYNVSQALIPTEHITMISTYNKSKNYLKQIRKASLSINKLLLSIPKLFGKDYS